jgi:glycerophosphoryl diester phosphodiesterase
LQDPHTVQWYPDADEMVDVARRAELTGVDLMAARIDAALIDRVRSAGLDLGTWTVDSPEEARRLIDLGVRRITTNCPGKLRAAL